MRSSARLLAEPGFQSFWKRSLDEFRRLSNVAIKLEGLEKPKDHLQLWDFSKRESVDGCVDMSDNDIGGYSKVELRHVPSDSKEPPHAHFTGLISNKLPDRENPIERTGYAAFRTKDQPSTLFGRSLWDVEHYNFLALRVKADGRKYKVNIQTESVEYTDLHQHRLYTRHPGEWETILIKWADFVRTNHGVIVEPQSEMLRERVRTIGIGLTDRLAGPFDFRISKIWATNKLTDEDIEESGRGAPAYLPKESGQQQGKAATNT